MKRSPEKIEKQNKLRGEFNVSRLSATFLIGISLILSLSSCQKAWMGRDGRPGNAFIALQWNEAEPTYIDAGTAAIPRMFYWDEFYKINPRVYQLYYEGSIWAGNGWANYSWQVDYEIWEVEGERGDWYYNGENGPDNYFSIECNPYGPYVSNSYKNAPADKNWEIIEESENKIILLQKADGVNLKITYARVNPRSIADKKSS